MSNATSVAADHARLLELLEYNPETGVFTRRVAVGRHGCHMAGTIAGGPNGNGYWQNRAFGRLIMAHRLVWFYVHGAWPKNQIDHINGVRDDNRICNLREATVSENTSNSRIRSDNTSGFKGVSWYKRKGKFRATIAHKTKQIALGYFSTAEAAHAVYCEAAIKLHGEFARFS